MTEIDADLVRVRFDLAYDGTGFHGFWPNPGMRTVGGTLREAIEQVLSHSVHLTCAGRTDTGVHARAQVVSFEAPSDVDLHRFQRSINSMCAPEIAITHAEVVADDFNARFTATARRYRYTVHNHPVPDPFLTRMAWHVTEPLDLRAMRAACDPFIGEHDFASFCRRPKVEPGAPPKSLVRRVTDATWEADGTLLYFHIRANAFCHQMVRSIVGVLVEVGQGRLRAGDMTGLIRARDRTPATMLAPPQGLMLMAVEYPEGGAEPAARSSSPGNLDASPLT